VEVTLDAGAAPIKADPDRLQQVLWNLLSNAVKFTPAGGRVEVRLTRTETDVEIKVSDTGTGVAPEFLPHMFERFRQADSRFTREYGGLGLGLAIARNLVEMHGGSIRAESPGIGLGSTFTVSLPTRTASGDADSSGELSRSGFDSTEATPGRVRLDGLHVMAVDFARNVCDLAGSNTSEFVSLWIGKAVMFVTAVQVERSGEVSIAYSTPAIRRNFHSIAGPVSMESILRTESVRPPW
jgi:hypothetical protein